MTQARRGAPSGRLGRSLVILATSSALVVTGCGGGGGGGDQGAAAPAATAPPAATTTLTAPTDKATALDYQYQAVAEARKAVEAILAADKAAVQALVDGRHADWDRYWTTEYPLLLGRLEAATDTLQQSENHVHKFVYGLGPVYTKEAAGEKFVPIPIVLGAIAAIAGIYALEKGGYRDRWQAGNAAEHQSLTAMLEQIYRDSGMASASARARASIDAGIIQTLRQTQTAIDTARTFVIDNFTIPAFSTYLPDSVSEVVDLKDIVKQLSEIKGNLEAIFTTKECRQVIQTKAHGGDGYVLHPERSALAASLPKSVATKAAGDCRIYFCSTKDGTCPNLPPGDWEAAVFAPGHLRGTDADVVSGSGGPVSIQATLVPAADIGAPPPVAQCSKVQNAGGDQADTRSVPLGAVSGSFTLTYEMYGIKDRIRVLYDGRTLFDSGCVGGGKTQLLPYSGVASFVTIQVEPNCTGTTSGTAWNYTVACPAAN
jgi:hypothetical protein